MGAKHTPGPWQLSLGWTPSPHAVVDTQNIYGGPSIGVVAKVVMAAQDGANLEERAANARLIAAAPDMMDALLSIAEGEWDENNPNAIKSIVLMARATIAKAEPTP